MVDSDFYISGIAVSGFSDFADRVSRSMTTNSGKFFSYSISDYIWGEMGNCGILSPTKTGIAATQKFLDEEYTKAIFQFRTSVDVFGDIKNARREYINYLDDLEAAIDEPNQQQKQVQVPVQDNTETTYAVVSDFNIEFLTKSVNARLKEGWVCIGGVSSVQYSGTPKFFQSMLKVNK